MKWFKKLFKSSKKNSKKLEEKTKTLCFKSDAKIIVEPGSENHVFAGILKTAVEEGNMNPGTLVTNFIENYLNTNENSTGLFISNYELKPTPEIRQLCNKLVLYRAKIHNDRDLGLFIKENSKLE